MQNKYINTAFYSFVIVITIFCGVLCSYRYKADIYFDLARKSVPGYALRNEGREYMQWAYKEAVKCNPWQLDNYSRLLNITYYRMIRDNIAKTKGG